MPNLKRKPVFTSITPCNSQSAESDGKLIVMNIILNHGYRAERFATLSLKQKDYIESTLCVIIRELCNHLEKLSAL